MNSKQFFGGILVGLAIGTLIGAALAEGKKEVNYTSMAGVGSLVALAGGLIARGTSPKS
jgi:hypothetical protein